LKFPNTEVETQRKKNKEKKKKKKSASLCESNQCTTNTFHRLFVDVCYCSPEENNRRVLVFSFSPLFSLCLIAI
jgi:hypothetical protein